MKEKLIGILALTIGVLAFFDAVRPGGLSVGIWHLKPFLFPAFAIAFGWIELHGRHQPFKGGRHHSMMLALAACLAVAAALALVFKVNPSFVAGGLAAIIYVAFVFLILKSGRAAVVIVSGLTVIAALTTAKFAHQKPAAPVISPAAPVMSYIHAPGRDPDWEWKQFCWAHGGTNHDEFLCDMKYLPDNHLATNTYLIFDHEPVVVGNGNGCWMITFKP